MAPTTLSNVTAPRVSDEHPFHDAQTGEWKRADALEPGDLLSALGGDAEVLSILFDQQRVPVYNLSIPNSPTYYVGKHGLWVHNAGPCDKFARALASNGAAKVDKVFDGLGGTAARLEGTAVFNGTTLHVTGAQLYDVRGKSGFEADIGPKGIRAIQNYLTSVARQLGAKGVVVEGFRENAQKHRVWNWGV